MAEKLLISLKMKRCIVSPIPGTTRDSIDVSFTQGDNLFTLIDTAGVRRKRAEHDAIDKFAAIRTEEAIERADVCLLMLDVQQGMTSQDKKIANQIEEQGKGCIILFNKWDLVKGFRMEHILQSIEQDVPFVKYCPKICISAKEGRNVEKILEQVKEIYEAAKQRITTHQLNKVIEKALQAYHPPMIDGKRLRIYYMTQVDIEPPTFLLFVNYPHLMTDTYKKYLYNTFRETYEFTGVPLRIFLKGKKRLSLEDRLEKGGIIRETKMLHGHEDAEVDEDEEIVEKVKAGKAGKAGKAVEADEDEEDDFDEELFYSEEDDDLLS